jgi:putative membrane protein
MKMAGADSPATFVKKAALDGMTEVELGKAALNKSQDPAIREFAERMVRDHGKANDELAGIAKRKGLQVPKELDAEHKASVQQLTAKSGASFDAAYAQNMADDHTKAVALFESASRMSDSDLAGFASKTLPTLKEHKQMADRLQAGKRSASATTSSAQPKQY